MPVTTTRRCGYFRKQDGSLWALLLIDGTPRRAVGPLPDSALALHPASHNLRTGAKVNPAEFTQVGELVASHVIPRPAEGLTTAFFN